MLFEYVLYNQQKAILKLNLFDEVDFVHDPNDIQLIVHFDEYAK